MRDIVDRFHSEVEKIFAYNNLMHTTSKLPEWGEFSWNIDQLDCLGFKSEELTYMQSLSKYPKDISSIFKLINESKDYLFACIDITHERLNYVPLENKKSEFYDEDFVMMVNENFFDADYYDFLELYSEENNLEMLLNFFEERYLIKFNRFGVNGQTKEEIEKMIEYDLKIIASEALDMYLQHVCTEYDDLLIFLDKLKTTLHINDLNNTLNVNRQSFILLMSSFDATIFDMTKKLLEERFYQYIAEFCQPDYKLRMKDFENFTSGQDMIDSVVDECLKQQYLKDLFKIYKKLEVFDDKVLFKNLMEITNRRNVHLHKSGICDEQYVTSYNLFSKNKGEYLEISENYLIASIDYCSKFVIKIIDWYEV